MLYVRCERCRGLADNLDVAEEGQTSSVPADPEVPRFKGDPLKHVACLDTMVAGYLHLLHKKPRNHLFALRVSVYKHEAAGPVLLRYRGYELYVVGATGHDLFHSEAEHFSREVVNLCEDDP